MNRKLIGTALAAALLAASPVLVAAQVMDTTPPVLTAFDFTPKTIDTSGGNATVTVTFAATDDLSGMHFFDMRFRSPSGSEALAQGNCHGLACAGTATATFAQYATEGGVWTVAWINIYDIVGNRRSYTTDALSTMGFPTHLLNASQAVPELQPVSGGGTVDGKSGKRKTVSLWARVQNIGSAAASNVQVGFEVSADGGATFTKVGGGRFESGRWPRLPSRPPRPSSRCCPGATSCGLSLTPRSASRSMLKTTTS